MEATIVGVPSCRYRYSQTITSCIEMEAEGMRDGGKGPMLGFKVALASRGNFAGEMVCYGRRKQGTPSRKRQE